MESFEVLDAIGSLVDKSLLQADPTGRTVRYRLLETVREYAAEKLSEDAEAEASAREAHARTFLELAEAAAAHLFGPRQAEWIRRLEDERDNLRTAAGHLLAAPGETDEAMRLAVALREFWYRSCHWSEGLELLRAALDRSDGQEPTVLRGTALVTAAHLCGYLGNFSSAGSYVAQGLGTIVSIDAPALKAELLEMTAWIAFGQGDYETAASVIDEAVDTARRASERRLIARPLMYRALIRSPFDPEGARADLSESLAHFREIGDQQWVGESLGVLGTLELLSGDLGAGRAHLEEADAIARLVSSLSSARAQTNLCLAAVLQGDISGALRAQAGSLRVFEEVGAREAVPFGLLAVGLCLTATGNLESAAEIHGAADALLEGLGQAFEPLEGKLREQDRSRLRQALGEKAFGSAYQAGRLLSSSQAIELAEQELTRAACAHTGT